jgi:hypothetical protein
MGLRSNINDVHACCALRVSITCQNIGYCAVQTACYPACERNEVNPASLL